MEVVTAFLNGELHEKINMEVPSGFRNVKKPNYVCRLLKALYGLKMAPRYWYAKIHHFLISQLKFVSSPYEPCLYTFCDKKVFLANILYVDDLLTAGSNLSDLAKVKEELGKHFKMKNLGVVEEYLGIQVIWNRTKRILHVSQSLYVDTILERF